MFLATCMSGLMGGRNRLWPYHVDPVATHGGRRCGLLHYEAMRRLLARRPIAVLFAREGELLYIESD